MPIYITMHSSRKMQAKETNAPSAPVAMTIAPGGLAAREVKAAAPAPPATLAPAAPAAASIPVCSHIWDATQIIVRSPNNMHNGAMMKPKTSVRKLIPMLFSSGTAIIAMKIGESVFKIMKRPHRTTIMISRIAFPSHIPLL